jgi:hypothetical protein
MRSPHPHTATPSAAPEPTTDRSHSANALNRQRHGGRPGQFPR